MGRVPRKHDAAGSIPVTGSIRPHRLAARTPALQAEHTGSSPVGVTPRKLTWWKRRSEEPKVLVRFQLEGPETGPEVGHLVWDQDIAGFDSLVSDYVEAALGSKVGCDPI